MKIKIIGFALLLGLATALGACEAAEETPITDTTPPAGEPADAPIEAPADAPEATPDSTP